MQKVAQIATETITTYVKGIYGLAQTMKIQVPLGHAIGYPTFALLSECEHHYILELFGCSFTPVEIQIHCVRSTQNITEYLWQFPAEQAGPAAFMEVTVDDVKIENLCYGGGVTSEAFEELRSLVWLPDKGSTLLTETTCAPLRLKETVNRFSMQNVILVNKLHSLARVRYCQFIFIFGKYLDNVRQTLQQGLSPRADGRLQALFPVASVNEKQRFIVNSLHTMAFQPGLAERELEGYAQTHSEVITGAFSGNEVRFQLRFEWQEGNPDPDEKSIIPDIMIRRKDRFWDICDLKRAAAVPQLTKGGHRRRRFVDVVNDGVAQLANYEDYFTFDRNAAWARDIHGVEVRDPKLILVCGNYQSATRQELIEASRPLHDCVLVLDYSSLASAYISSTKRSL